MLRIKKNVYKDEKINIYSPGHRMLTYRFEVDTRNTDFQLSIHREISMCRLANY